MQKNVPKYAPDFVRTVSVWAQSAGREVAYPLCGDRRTLLWYANQRAVEYHPALVRAGNFEQPDVLVLDVDPPPGPATRAVAARAERLEPGLATTAFLREDRGGKVLIDAAAMHDGKRRARARRERGAAGSSGHDG